MEIVPAHHDGVQTFVFFGREIRALLIEGKPWFVRADITSALDINPRSTLVQNLPAKGVFSNYPLETAGGRQGVTLINEGNLYRLILRSDSKNAADFQDWVTEKVLPQIRETGSYGVAPVKELSGAELMAKALIEAQSVLAAKDERIAELEPKAETYDKVLTPKHTMNLTELSANLREHFPVNRNDVKAKLLEKGLLYQNVLKATARAVDGGWAVQRPQGVHGGKERFQPRFTTKTLEWLLDEFAPLEDVA
ncbi:BRO family protein [uncultured Rothia sp.]|uniref:BRO family protein n=1 Tax=uncultured Rothia sp. TaxID=316088 RepID=UPI003217C064